MSVEEATSCEHLQCYILDSKGRWLDGCRWRTRGQMFDLEGAPMASFFHTGRFSRFESYPIRVTHKIVMQEVIDPKRRKSLEERRRKKEVTRTGGASVAEEPVAEKIDLLVAPDMSS